MGRKSVFGNPMVVKKLWRTAADTTRASAARATGRTLGL
jgi:hypothetical protein